MSVAFMDLNRGEESLSITTNEALQRLAIFTQFYKHVTRHTHLMILVLTVLILQLAVPPLNTNALVTKYINHISVMNTLTE